MTKPNNLKAGDQFRVIVEDGFFSLGEIISLKIDGDSDCPLFLSADKSESYFVYWSELEPIAKTIRDAQVGDVVINEDGEEHMVLERGQNTVLISFGNEFKIAHDIYTFDQLKEYFTLKAEPVVDDKMAGVMAEVMEILKSKGYKFNRE